MQYRICKYCGKKGVHKVGAVGAGMSADRSTWYRSHYKCKYCNRIQ